MQFAFQSSKFLFNRIFFEIVYTLRADLNCFRHSKGFVRFFLLFCLLKLPDTLRVKSTTLKRGGIAQIEMATAIDRAFRADCVGNGTQDFMFGHR